jgi:outer membrane protein assembly factor BamB
MKRVFLRLFNAIALFVLIFNSACGPRGDLSDWRGPNRDGIFPETGLLKVWPDEGPTLRWSVDSLGLGHNSVAVTRDRVYVTGVADSAESMGILSVLDLNGKLLWIKKYGREYTSYLPGTRSTPVVVDNLIYIESGSGSVYCLDTGTGDEVWSVDFLKDLGVDSLIQFGNSESVLIDGDRVVCVPGGREHNVVALDRFTGETIWSCAGNGEQATYNSPIVIETGSNRLIIAMTAASIMGIDAATGELYWHKEQTQGNHIHGNTPLWADGKLVVSSVDAKSTSGMVQVAVSTDGKNAEETWRNKKFRNAYGGIVRVDTCIYGSMAFGKNWQVLGWNSGEMLAQNNELEHGSIIYADGLFYCFTENDGEVALVDAGPDHFKVISSFKIPVATEQHWARPVIRDGSLYIRHGENLLVYDIRAASKAS